MGAGSAVGSASGLLTSIGVAAPPAVAAKQTADAIVAAYVEYLKRLRWSNDGWLRRTLERSPVSVPQQMVLDLVADEAVRQTEFERRVMDRVRRAAPRIEAIPDPAARRTAAEGLVSRERTYGRFRAEAMAVRALALVDRVVLRQESPAGAFWKLDPNVRQHTPDCIAMGGRFWPWQVLDGFHPPTHAGCRCSLHSFATARERLGLQVADLMSLDEATRRAAAARALLHEGEFAEWEQVRDALIRTGVTSEEGLATAVRALVQQRLDRGGA